MDQPGSSQAPSSTSTTENPIVAVGRKVKSALSSSSNQPSIRIFRSSSSHGKSYRLPTTEGNSEKRDATRPHTQADFTHNSDALPKDHGKKEKSSFADRCRALFRHGDSDKHESYENEYDTDTVDLLDVVGMYPESNSRRRSSNLPQIQKYLLCPLLPTSKTRSSSPH
jgi:hypothetical protein